MRMVKTPDGPVDLKTLLDRVQTETGLNKAQLAGLVGINPSQLSRWATGSVKPRFDSLVSLGRILRDRYPGLTIGPDDLVWAGGYSLDATAHGPPARTDDGDLAFTAEQSDEMHVGLLALTQDRELLVRNQQAHTRLIRQLESDRDEMRAEIRDLRKKVEALEKENGGHQAKTA